uniref:Uncharacterized protein n=1 Tax=Hyaloperonospora arabidopsidis (strain Emoy2) TaxID=559515 RepID=M4BXF2_HYAAE
MQKRQPKFQQQQQQYQGGQRGRGRGGGHHAGRGRGGFIQPHPRQNREYAVSQFQRKRGASDELRDASRFFLPSFLLDPWEALKCREGDRDGEVTVDTQRKSGCAQEKEGLVHERQVPHAVAKDGHGRVLFQPSFLEYPWMKIGGYISIAAEASWTAS